ncbi:AEC family transporter [candidate division WOR-3 bacterium]|nr:AEC family transporter [candidate division WOR-3 bacterium]
MWKVIFHQTEAFQALVKTIALFVIIYMLAIILKRRGTLTEEHSGILAKIVTDLCLPAVIFITLAGKHIRLNQLSPAFVMLSAEILCIALAWLISKGLKFNRFQQGAIVFCAAFGSSSFLGYPLIIQMFPHKTTAITEAVIISEIGVGYPIFILGPVLACYFGAEKSKGVRDWSISLKFFHSPIFFALIIGFLWGYFHLPGESNPLMYPFFKTGHVLASALTPLAILSVGLMFKLPKFREILLALIVVILLKLLFKPLYAHFLSSIFKFPQLWRDVLVLLSGMPPAILGVVFLKRYGGDASLASALLLSATIISCITLLVVFWSLA